MQGVVIKSTGSWFSILSDDGKVTQSKLRGKFRMKGIKATNPVAVGDEVVYNFSVDGKTGWITQILPRHNYIVRKSTKLSKVSHIIASNVDQAIIVATLAYPRTSTGFIDRFLITTEAYHIPAILVFNKIDLYDKNQMSDLDKLVGIYENIGYQCLLVSAIRGDNLDLLKGILKNKKSLFSGHSGVGKSALANALQPGLQLKTNKISDVHNKGLHTTTFAEMHPLTFGGFLIDTPGIKEFGLTDFNRKEIAERFPEMREFMHECKFNNCTHIHEPDCAVIQAIEEGKINLKRYENYLSILSDDYWEKIENDYRER
ncbi:MAG: ribosome small subunit-dependent GTPase A [Bacteroidetes bacterium]|nr:MAG: ribosome small subunit-dependent GTPase A [Bacteroidota bacterium]